MGVTIDTAPLTGHRPSDLPEAGALDGGTLLAVQPSGGKVCRIDYDQLSSSAAQGALQAMNVGSMAFVDEWQYSKINHDHDNYSATTAAVYKSQSGDGTTQKIGTLSVGDIGVDGLKSGKCQVVDIYCLSVQCVMPAEPEYGTLRFMYSTVGVPTAPNAAYVMSDNFDGWLFPDGSEITGLKASQFTKSGNPFVTRDGNPFVSGSGNNAKLTLPDLRGCFVRPTAKVESGKVKFATVPAHVAVPAHDHKIEKLDASVGFKLNKNNCVFNGAKDNGKKGAETANWGKGGLVANGNPHQYTATVKLDTCEVKLKTTQNSSTDAECYPSHQTVPVMIYVGGRKKPYDQIYLV